MTERECLEHGIVLAPRRPEYTRAAFQQHYESVHAPLFHRHAGDAIGRYLRNHIVRTYGANTPFDTISEFGIRPSERAAMTARLRAPEARALEEDVHRFLAERGNSFPVEETLISGPPRGARPGQAPVRKRALMLRGGDGEALARSLIDAAQRVTLTRWISEQAPLSAMVMLWLAPGATLDPVGGVAFEADVDEYCTAWTD